MNSNLFRFMNEFWEVEHKPKHSLHKVKDDEVNLKTANLFYIAATISVFLVAVSVVVGGIL